ncbi:MAG: glycosyl hydrolase family 2, partial [Prevotella sp.]|nr:glycosyl hydrolase family 2 [Prevotella sp.]
MKRIFFLISLVYCGIAAVHAQQWPTPQQEAKAGARWWWMGSAVDKDNLDWTMQQYADHGIGALEITPLYGVQGNQKNNIPYLSDKWMEMLRHVQANGKKMGIEVDMATGTGWPFGGPWVPLEESACKVVFVETTFTGGTATALPMSVTEKDNKYSRLSKVMAYGNGHIFDVTSQLSDGRLTWSPKEVLTAQMKATKDKVLKKALKAEVKGIDTAQWQVIALYVRYGVMKVKRAAPGGEGLVIDHFDRKAVANYLHHIEQAFERTHTPYPHTFFNDSYEVSEATWTPTLFEEFEKRRGYKMEEHLPELFSLSLDNHPSPLSTIQVVSDYRETLSDMLLENFTQQWTAWAHSHGAITRNQAHGSPANLIDCYAAVDIPEIEGFGLSNLGIRGLRTDPGKTRKNDADYSMFKYAPSAAHICGKPYTSSETFTWLTEHFRTSLSQLKPDLDLMFCAGVNHMFFHGTCYSPKDDAWPGWKFYASIDMSPTNSIWRDAPYFMQYVERCQSFLQWGQPDNDFLVYLPIRDMWQKNTKKLLMQFSIHAMGKLAPEFIQTILAIDRAGFDCDYISERLLLGVTCKDGMLQTAAGTRYKGLIIPGSGNMPDNVKQHIAKLKAEGAHIFNDVNAKELAQAAKPETMKTQYGLKAIRRRNNMGYHYFIANLTPNDINEEITLGVDFKDALWFDPLTGERYTVNKDDNKIRLSLRSGQSLILETFDQPQMSLEVLPTLTDSKATEKAFPLNGIWTLTFTEEAPKVAQTFKFDKVQTWETLADDSAKVTMGTGVYTTSLQLSRKDINDVKSWQIDLGDVRESARVYINGQFIGCAWSVPFVLDCKKTLKAGKNDIRIEVTNLPANRIADLDRRGVKWRKMEEINVVDINYKKTTYDSWTPV